MKELPYFRFTVQEWQNGGISTLNDSLKGVFVDVCAYYWAQNCNVTMEILSNKFKTKTKSIQKLIDSQTIYNQNGIVSISFLDQQLSELKQNKTFFSEMGKLGQIAKKNKAPLKTDLSYKDKDKDKEKEKDNIPEWIFEKWQEWEVHRAEMKKKLTPSAIKKQLSFLEKRKDEAAKIIDRSIMNGWIGLFELDEKQKPKTSTNYTTI